MRFRSWRGEKSRTASRSPATQAEPLLLQPFAVSWKGCTIRRRAGSRTLLRRAHPIRFERGTSSGRTEPSLITCELDSGEEVEVVAKFSAGCFEGEISLAMEVLAACLAADLGLPIPEPFAVEVSPEWANTIPDAARRAKILAGSPVAFGSRLAVGQFAAWNSGNQILDAMRPKAAGIFVFDAAIQNVDRRTSNPNCLVRGDDLIIFDHELAFSHRLPLLGWIPPWRLGGLTSFEHGGHIFWSGLKGSNVDLSPVRAAWAGLSDSRIADYEAAVPAEWANAASAVAVAAKLIRDARDNMDGVLAEVRRVLS
ncbi:HipA family kinase [Xanthobacter autotrophicus]|uniref:HipA family kinase n=1 Tax=Xanthobacter autotrophicus TaxID=280 RepID=UPI002B4C2053|nr:HipA family kinase [Xanthobacter autotrophicus]